MKKLFPLLFIPFVSFSQIDYAQLDGNSINASLSNTGVFFRDSTGTSAGYEFPKESGNHLIYSTSFWFGAIDVSGALKLAAEINGETVDGVLQRDLYPGAIKADGTAEAPEVPYADKVYVVSREEILLHASNYGAWDYEMPDAIQNWPAHGDVALGLANNLAPFADLNGNGLYEPNIGEYPEIRGDHAVYLILNDTGGEHLNSGGEPLGIEVHFMFYQFEDTDLSSTTFVNVRVFNRSTQSYPEFIIGNYMDADIGSDSFDDLVGRDISQDLIYTYNGDLLDEGGYEDAPPCIGIKALNHTLESYVTVTSGGFSFPPSTAVEYWNYLSGEYAYSAPDVPSDYKSVVGASPVALNAGEALCYDYAFMVAQVGTAFENRDHMPTLAADVQAHYNSQTDIYCDWTLGIDQMEEDNEVLIFPNPILDHFYIDGVQNCAVQIYGADGRLVYQQDNLTVGMVVKPQLATGSYWVKIVHDSGEEVRKIIIQ